MQSKLYVLGFITFGLLLTLNCEHVFAKAKGGKPTKTVRHSYQWSSLNIQSAKNYLKPILVYMHGPEKNKTALAKTLENKVLLNDQMIAFGKQMTCIDVEAGNPNWPANMSAAAKQSGAFVCVLYSSGSMGVYLDKDPGDKGLQPFFDKVKTIIEKDNERTAQARKARQEKIEAEKKALLAEEQKDGGDGTPGTGFLNKRTAEKKPEKKKEPLLLEEE